MQYIGVLLEWGKAYPKNILVNGSDKHRCQTLGAACRIALKHWSKKKGVKRPKKKIAMTTNVFFPLMDSLDLTTAVGRRNAAMWSLAFFTGIRAKDMADMTWDDLKLSPDQKSFELSINQSKVTSVNGSTRKCRIGQRDNPKVKFYLNVNRSIPTYKHGDLPYLYIPSMLLIYA